MEQEYEFAAQSRYVYFDRSYRAELAMFMIFTPTLITLWAVVGGYYYYNGQIWFDIAKAAAYCTVTLIFALILYGNTRALRRAGSVIVGREQIVKRGAGGVSALNCADIRGVRWSGIPLIRRWITLETPQKSLRLPLYIRDGHEMIEKVFAILEERGLSFEGAAGLKARLCGMSKRFNILHNLRAGHLPNLIRAATASALFNGGVAALYWECTLLTTLLWGFMSMLLQALAYFAAERFYVNKLLNGEDGGPFDRSYALSGLIALLVGMAVFGMAIGVLVTETA